MKTTKKLERHQNKRDQIKNMIAINRHYFIVKEIDEPTLRVLIPEKTPEVLLEQVLNRKAPGSFSPQHKAMSFKGVKD